MADMLAQIQALKAELLTGMRAADVATVRVEYSGSGDDGCIDSIELDPRPTDADVAKALTESAERLDRSAHRRVPRRIREQ